MRARTAKWEQVWGREVFAPEARATALEQLRADAANDEHLPTITAEQVSQAAKVLSTTKGVGTDRWHPAAWRSLPAQAASDMAELLSAIERQGQWPAQALVTRMSFIPKTDGGGRPIGIATTLFRIWQRIRAGRAHQWEAEHRQGFDSAAKGANPLRAALLRAAKAEIATKQ